MRKLDDKALEHVARYFGALAVPMRLKILIALHDGELNVGGITSAIGCTQANVSKHLALLTERGLLQRSTRGTSVYYRIADEAIYELCDLVCGSIDKRFSSDNTIGRMFAATARASRRAREARRR